MAAVSSDLLARFAAAEVDGARQRFGEALRDNPDGEALFRAAIERAAQIGFDAWCDIAGAPPDAPEDQLWGRWWAQRQLAPEAASWPVRLAGEDGVGTDALLAAEDQLLDAGVELGLTGTGRGRFARRLRELGAEAAEAGAALRCALDPDALEPAPREAEAAPVFAAPPRDDVVRVATTANQAECELLQGLLENEGIPSYWLRSGGDVPDYMAAGWRDIYVPVSTTDRARIILSTVEDEGAPVPVEDATTQVGLERSWLRRVGKTGATLYVVGVLGAAVLTAALAVAGVSLDRWGAIVLLGSLVLLVIAVVTWSERR